MSYTADNFEDENQTLSERRKILLHLRASKRARSSLRSTSLVRLLGFLMRFPSLRYSPSWNLSKNNCKTSRSINLTLLQDIIQLATQTPIQLLQKLRLNKE